MDTGGEGSHQANKGLLSGLASLWEAADGYQQAKQNGTWAVAEAKTPVWEKFGKAMEKDFWSATKQFWQTVRRLRRGKQCSTHMVYSAGGVLLTSTDDNDDLTLCYKPFGPW